MSTILGSTSLKAFSLLFLCCLANESYGNLTRESLEIIRPSGETLVFEVEVAKTHAEQVKGLSFRRELGERKGMLFVYTKAAKRRFWMRNTYIPLDIIFIDSEGIIRHIHHNAQPLRDERIASNGRAQLVLELSGGSCRKFKIEIGSRVKTPWLGQERWRENQ